jgi:RecA/RadA recombinase
MYGPKGIGKTSFSLSILGDIANSTGKGISILDFEIQSKETVAGILDNSGFDGSVHYVQNQAKERPEDTVERFVDRMFDKGDGKNSEYRYANPDVGLMDSIGGFHPAAEVEGKIGDANMGKKAFEMGQISRRFIRSLQLAENPHTIIMTNHEHPNFQSIGFGNSTITSGGESKKYMSQIRIRLSDAYIKKENLKDSSISGGVKFDGAWLVEGKVNENRFGISDQKFWCFLVGGEGIHAGLTAIMECLILGKAESSAKTLSETATISLDGTSYGKLGKIIRDRKDDELFKAFRNALKIDTESSEDE